MTVAPSSAKSQPAAATRPKRRFASRARFIVGWSCLAAIACVGWFIVRPQLSAYYHWAKAQEALEADDFPRAQAELMPCIETWGTSGEARFVMARTCRRAGDFISAREHLRESRRLGWPTEALQLEEQLVQAQSGLVAAVEPALRRLLARGHTEEPLILEALAAGCLQCNFVVEAHRWTSIWVERHPGDWQAHYWSGRVLEAGLQSELAAEAYERALEHRPGNVAARRRLAQALLRLGRYAEALPHFQAVVERDPNAPDSLLGLARCCRALGQPGEAVACLERLLAASPEHPGALLLRGLVEQDADNLTAALDWMRRAEARDPQGRELAKALATVLRLLGQAEAAQAAAGRSRHIEDDYHRLEAIVAELRQKPNEPGLRREAGAIALRQGRPEEAFRWLTSAALLQPDDRATQEALAECARRLRTGASARPGEP